MTTGEVTRPLEEMSADVYGRSLPALVASRVRDLAADAAALLERISPPADPEALHDFRVAVRRLDAALKIASSLRANGFQSERQCLRWAFRSVGRPRDLDVQLAILESYRTRLPENDRSALAPVETWFERQRGPWRSAMHRKLRSQRLNQVLSALAHFEPDEKPPEAANADPGTREIPQFVLDRGKRLAKTAKSLSARSASEEFHRTRIQVKRVRYAIEAFPDVLPKQAAKFSVTLTKMQSRLGDEHDAVVLAETLDRLLTQHGALWPAETRRAVRLVERDLQKRSARLRRKFVRRYAKPEANRWRRTRKALRTAMTREEPSNLEAATHPARSGGTTRLIPLAG